MVRSGQCAPCAPRHRRGQGREACPQPPASLAPVGRLVRTVLVGEAGDGPGCRRQGGRGTRCGGREEQDASEEQAGGEWQHAEAGEEPRRIGQ